MNVLNITNLHIQIDWPSGEPPTPEQLADLHKQFNMALFTVEGEPCVMGDEIPGDWEVEVTHDGVLDLNEVDESDPIHQQLRAASWPRDRIEVLSV